MLPGRKDDRTTRVWIHASSVGEVNAAAVLIRELADSGSRFAFVVSTMTTTGQDVARRLFPDDVVCFLAPFDLQPAVRLTVERIRPDIYACLETELWPVMLMELRKRGVRMLLLNGRMTERSFKRYSLISGLLKEILSGFSSIGVISSRDGERFAALGVPPHRIHSTGNIKYDFPGEDIAALRQVFRTRLNVRDETVFICGSTRSGEERILADVFRGLCAQSDRDLLWVLAPRHLQRLPEIEAMLSEQGLAYDLYTELKLNNRERTGNVVLINCLGELSQLYSAGDFIFVGGSLVECGGHNLMEAGRCGRPVYYGPHVDDFRDAADMLEAAGAGFMVRDGDQLVRRIMHHMRDRAGYDAVCRKAHHTVSRQHGVARKQAGMIMDVLNIQRNNKAES